MTTSVAKKVISIFAVAMMVVLVALGCVACNKADEGTDYGLAFQANEDKKTCRLVGIGDCEEKEIVIPSTYKKMTVTSIQRNAFSGSDLESVTIPGSVTEIGDNAFRGCESLLKVVLEEKDGGVGVTVGRTCFEDCTALKEVILSSSVTSVGEEAFNGCYSLEKLTVAFVGSDNRAENEKAVFGYVFGTTEFKKSSIVKQYYKSGSFVQYYLPDSLKEVTVLGGELGYGAFYNCSKLTKITVGKNVSTIDQRTFYNCSGLKTVEFEEGVTDIKKEAFIGCSSLTAVVLPDSLTALGSDAFRGCAKISHVTIGTGLKNMGESCFENCTSIETLTIKEGAAKIGTKAFYNCPKIKQVVIPGSVESVGANSFYHGESIQSLVMSDGTTKIMEGAFSGCSNLKTATLPETLSTVSKNAFADCGSLAEVSFGNKLTAIGEGAFKNCVSLKELVLPATITSLGSNAFDGCEGLSYFNYLGDVNQWVKVKFGSYSSNPVNFTGRMYVNGELLTELDGLTGDSISKYAFCNCQSLVKVTLPEQLKKDGIGEEAFIDCSKLVEIVNNSSIALTVGAQDNGYVARYARRIVSAQDESALITEGDFIFFVEDGQYYLVNYTGNESEITLPSACRGNEYEIYRHAFGYNKNLVKVTLSDGVTAIGDSAFYFCKSLVNVEMGDHVSGIGEYAFNYCVSLKAITVPDSVKTIGKYAFRYCTSLTDVVIGNGLTEMIKEPIFFGCGSIEELTLPFFGFEDEEITNDSQRNHLGHLFGDVYFSGAEEVSYGGRWGGESVYYIPSSLIKVTVTEGDIKSYAFMSITTLQEVVILKATSIGSFAFYGCSALAKIGFSDGLQTLGRQAFGRCLSLSEVVLPAGLTAIPSGAFYGCSGLLGIIIPQNVTSIGDDAFARCNHLMVVINKSSLNIVAGSADYGYVARYAVVVTDDENAAGKTETDGDFCYYVFGDVVFLMSYKGNATELVLDKYKGKSYMIYNNAFSANLNLVKLTIKDGVTEIGYRAFSECRNLTTVTIGSCVKTISAEAFRDCGRLKEIILNEGVEYIGDQAFQGLAITSLIIPDSVKEIGSYIVYKSYSLEYVVLGKGIETIGNQAFVVRSRRWGDANVTSALTSVYYRDTVDKWGTITVGERLYADGVTLYYYSETEVETPAENTYYWHYDGNGNIVRWNEPIIEEVVTQENT
ncbi:MAG: leucine-rich repeat domain-containing protein [Christensenellales bacterium]